MWRDGQEDGWGWAAQGLHELGEELAPGGGSVEVTAWLVRERCGVLIAPVR